MTLDTEQVRELCRARDAGIIADAALHGSDHAQAIAGGANSGELVQLAQAGADARHQLVDNGIGLVKYVINKTNFHGDWTDVFQEGVLAVVKAVDSYDPDRGAFSTFMWPHIRGAVLITMATDSMRLHLSPRQARERAKVLTEISTREAAGLPATTADLASALNLSDERVGRALAYRHHAPLEDPLLGGQDFTDRRPDTNERTIPIGRYVAMLPPDERHLLEQIHGLNGQSRRPGPQIATTLGCSLNAVRRLQDQAHEHLRDLLVHFGESTYDPTSDTRRDERTHRLKQAPRVEKQTRASPQDRGSSRTGLDPRLGR